jgi:hypothetical protein
VKTITYGITHLGNFRFSIQPPVFDNRAADDAPFFSVLVSEIHTKSKPELTPYAPFFTGLVPDPEVSHVSYVHLVEDPRFALFASFGKFERPIRVDEITEYNTYIDRRHNSMPLWKLSRSTLQDFMEIAAKPKPLTPPDKKRCQAEVPNGHSFMTLGGTPGGRVRCSNIPAFIAKENKPGKDGRKGSMSLCESCSKVFVDTLGPSFATLTPIKPNA